MCPQANLSEIVLGGNGGGADLLDHVLKKKERPTIGGYFDTRIESPHTTTGDETSYLKRVKNSHLPRNLFLIPRDPSLEIQAQVINQIGGQTLPLDSWRNVHSWLDDLLTACERKVGGKITVFIDCNPSFSAYTEIAMSAAERLIVPCSSDGSSARAIDNVGALLYDIGDSAYSGSEVSFKAKSEKFDMTLPIIHSVILNRSTTYDQKASKAFGAMFDEIKKRTEKLREADPSRFVGAEATFKDVPDTHSVAIVCSHLGKPLYSISPGNYPVHSENPAVGKIPLERYQKAISELMEEIQ